MSMSTEQPRKRGRPPGAPDRKPRKKREDVSPTAFTPTPGNDRTELIGGRVSPDVRKRLEAEGESLNWGERIERMVRRIINSENGAESEHGV